jgi:hypothetical protein
MKKRIFAMLLSALLVANISACNYVPENELTTDMGSDELNLNVEDIDQMKEAASQNANTESETWYSIACDGVYRNSNVQYTVNKNGDLCVYIGDWNKKHLVTSLSDDDIEAFGNTAKSVVLNNDYAFLFLKRYDISTSKITVLRFDKTGKSETVTSLTVGDAVYKFGGNFISKNVGYLFAFKEEAGIHAKGDSKLSSLFITEDGGNTWNSISVQSAPSISLSTDIIFSKMISENVGIISGRYWANDYDFCERTLLTTNGGRNWECISTLPKINILSSPEVTDFTKQEESYILTVRHITSENGYEYAKYKSSDLNVWMHID